MTTDNKERIADAAWLAIAVLGGFLLIGAGVLLASTSAPQIIALGMGFLGGLGVGAAILTHHAFRRPRR